MERETCEHFIDDGVPAPSEKDKRLLGDAITVLRHKASVEVGVEPVSLYRQSPQAQLT